MVPGLWMRLGPALLVLSLMAGSVPAGASSGGKPPDPLAVVLRPSEAPVGFVQTSGRDLTALEAARGLHEPAAQYSSEGHVQTAFAEFDKFTANGANVITVYVATFRTPTRAHQAYLSDAKSSAARRLSALKFAMIGQESFGSAVTVGRMLTATAVFRRDSYLVLLTVQSIGGTFKPAKAVELARIIDGHIVHPAMAAGVSARVTATSSPLPSATASSTGTAEATPIGTPAAG